MKRLFIIVITASSFFACRNANNQTGEVTSNVSVGNENATAQVAPADAAVIVFESDVFDFGKIKSGDQVQHDFKFKNTGKSPLIITNATATCGCTIPEIPKAPILPGKDGLIKIIFNSEGKSGLQDKVVTITSNAKRNMTTVHLIGEVLESK